MEGKDMKKLIAMLLALAMVFALCACGAKAPAEGKVFNIYAWNEEFKGFFKSTTKYLRA